MIAWTLLFVILPAPIILVCRRVPLLGKLGAVAVCYVAGIALATRLSPIHLWGAWMQTGYIYIFCGFFLPKSKTKWQHVIMI